MTLRIAIGTDNFRFIRENKAYYVDKTAFIGELVAELKQSILVTRPRRFGKSLNLSMLRYFFDRTDEDLSWMFEDLAVWKDAQAREHFQRHPVVMVNFKDTKEASWELVRELVQGAISTACKQHSYLLDSGKVSSADRDDFERLYRRKAQESEYHDALPLLSRMLHAHHGEPVVLLIDEYDAPIHAGFVHDFAEPVLAFFRNFLGAGFKSNDHLYRGVLTGVLRIAKESIFSELNNVEVYSVLSSRFADCCGFTETEVARLAQDAGLPDRGEGMAKWYNGYKFGDQTIYNPWSVLNYVDKQRDGLRSYWVSSGSHDVLRTLVLEQGVALFDDMQTLLSGGTIKKRITEHVSMRQLPSNATAVWSLLVMSGYLTVESSEINGQYFEAELRVPNREVRQAFESSVLEWVQSADPTDDRLLGMLTKAMLRGDEETFGELLQDVVMATISPRDLAKGSGVPPEKAFQAFVLGMLVSLEREYEVRSEEECGLGRCDVLVKPKTPGKAGVVLEFKRAKGKSKRAVQAALKQALEQIDEQRYVSRLREAGAEPVVSWGVVFDGKRVWVRHETS